MTEGKAHYVVQLDVDTTTQFLLDQLDAALAPLTGLKTLHQLGSAHHLSLAIYDAPPTAEFLAVLKEFAETLSPITLRLVGLGVFPGIENTLFLAPVWSQELLVIHQRFHDAHRAGAPPCWDYYKPDAWVPHVTLAANISPSALPEAIRIANQLFQPRDAKLVNLRLIEAFPVKTLALHSLDLAPTPISV